MWQLQRLVGALLGLVSAILLLVSPFLSLFIGTLNARAAEFTMTIDGWGFDSDAPQQFGAVAVNAYGLIFSAVLLFAAAIISVNGARRGATPSNRRMAAVFAAVAAAFTLGVAVTVLPQLTNWIDTFRPVGLASARVNTSIGMGFWLMAIGTVLALAAAVIAALPTRDREPVTPAYGIPIPVGHQGQPMQSAQFAAEPAQPVYSQAQPAPEPAQPGPRQDAGTAQAEPSTEPEKPVNPEGQSDK
ncbi:hypothetical protein [Kibdelosporangium phytohabitans]|uniref:Uncharacterized protein n=1 Tax=Kibdelosporangium phytohabitans TaxID=860235 RepID=A0A0N9I6T1_9PSEU|nr:hypothetical protein [Kibdelosporangium phytohabitans]ALG13873.1 hypothetical protein AOZ06_49665 [Kibdelosporangium phytohabitans]MBE1467192.1 putative membrane protein required for colicin V production [Kibdelosporangium phytohabitans]